MKNTCKGFSLVECMVYSMLFALMATTWFHVLITMQYKLTQHSVMCNKLTELYTAHDVCVRDLRHAPHAKSKWFILTDTRLVWHNGTTYIGWNLDDHKIMRYEGTYDVNTDTWHTYKKSVVTEHVDNAYFDILYNAHAIISVAVVMHVAKHVVTREVYIHA